MNLFSPYNDSVYIWLFILIIVSNFLLLQMWKRREEISPLLIGVLTGVSLFITFMSIFAIVIFFLTSF